MEDLIKYKWMILVGLIIVLAPFLSYLFYLNWIFSGKEPSEDDYVQVFEKCTQTELPKSASLIKKDYLFGLHDGWKAGVIKVKDSSEFFTLKKKIQQKEFIFSRKKKPKTGYFGSGISRGFKLYDTINKNSKQLFVLEFLNDEQIIIFEKSY